MELKDVMDDISKDIADATETLFKTMIMMDLKFNGVSLANEMHIKTDVASYVSFMGKYHGIVGIFCSRKFSLKIASSMLMEEMTGFTTEVIDAMGEVSNMIAGNVKTKITADYGEMDLSIPMVIVGGNTNITISGDKAADLGSELSCFTKEPWLITNFSSDNETFDIGLLLKETTQ